MKATTLALTSVILLFSAALAAAPNEIEEKTFHVRFVQQPGQPETREKLIEIYEAVRERFTINSKGEILRIADALPAGTREINGTVLQSLSNDQYMISINLREKIHIKTTGTRRYADGDRVALRAQPIGYLDYETVLGASARVRSYKEVDLPVITRDAFTEALRSGMILKIGLAEERTCLPCRGRGTVRGRADKGQSPDRMYPCPACPGASGKNLVPVSYTVQW